MRIRGHVSCDAPRMSLPSPTPAGNAENRPDPRTGIADADLPVTPADDDVDLNDEDTDVVDDLPVADHREPHAPQEP